VLELRADVLVVGGGLGGVAAALAACRAGRDVVLTEETDWVGGQLTSQAVPPDEHPWIEQFGATASYRELRDGIREHYRRWYPLRAEAARLPNLNPGAGRVSKLCHEPRVSLAVLEAMLAPHRAAGRLTVLLETVPVGAECDGDRVGPVELLDRRDGRRIVVSAPYVVDATEAGDVLALTKTEYVTGAEARSDHDEPHAPAEADPQNMQGFTFCFALDHRPGEEHTIDRPERYDFWRSYRPEFWPGPLIGLLAPHPRTLEPIPRTFEPNPGDDPLDVVADQSKAPGDLDLWLFRRILARGLHTPGAFSSDITLVNWPMNDYWLGSVVDVEPDVAARHLADAKQLSRSLLYWLQTEAPRPDGGTGWPGLRLRTDVTGTADGLAKAPYLRESRRIRALTTVTENDVSLAVRGAHGVRVREDSVGVGSYHLDLHPSTGGDTYIDLESVPFEIPLGSLVPQRVRNLIPAAKNIGTTHISNGCFRLHPVEWNVGEVAGLLAAYCVETGGEPHQVHADRDRRDEFTRLLEATGVERHWPEVKGY
jgi:FAD-dependent oxidoreductase family protein